MQKPAWREALESLATIIEEDAPPCGCGKDPLPDDRDCMLVGQVYCDNGHWFVLTPNTERGVRQQRKWRNIPAGDELVFCYMQPCPHGSAADQAADVDAAKDEYVTVTGEPMWFETFQPDGDVKALGKILAFAANPIHRTLVIGGEPGRGKTHLARGLYIQWLSENRPCQWFPSEKLAETFRRAQSYNNDTDDRTAGERKLAACESAFAVFIDDLCTERETESELFVEQFKVLLDAIRGHIVITTNKNSAALLKRYGEKITSRIFAGATTITMDGANYREKHFPAMNGDYWRQLRK